MAVNVYELVTKRILEQLKQGIIPWRKTWKGSVPVNYVTQKAYRGVNSLLLPQGGEYLTFLQTKQAGGNVRKGEKSQLVVFFKPMEVEDKDTGEKKTIPYLKYSNVFHISQCEGITSKLNPVQADEVTEPMQDAQSIIDDYVNRSGVVLDIVEGSAKAYYQPSLDRIVLPSIKQFTNANDYYSVAFHEASHSTGHLSRLNRISDIASFGSQSYSREELVAEISAAMVMNNIGLEIPATFENSTAYINGWLKRIRGNDKEIVQASSQAQKATDMILGVEDSQ